MPAVIKIEQLQISIRQNRGNEQKIIFLTIIKILGLQNKLQNSILGPTYGRFERCIEIREFNVYVLTYCQMKTPSH